MPIEVDPDWWKTLFDDVYLLTDARSVGDESLTRLEVDVVCELLPMEADHKILDLCGGHGRHSFELCKRGFEACTLIDYSHALIDVAKEKVRKNNYSLKVVRCDARQIDLGPDQFNHVLIMGNSLGYIQQSDADKKILSEAFKVLRPGGWLLRGDSVRARELVISKKDGLIRDRTYAVRLYEPQTLASLLEMTGFGQIKIHTDFSPHRFEGDYGFMNRRMLGIGQKP
jgi:D-alanine-D-alanine ligase